MNFLYTQYYTNIAQKKRLSHGIYLYRQWNNPTAHSTTKKTSTINQRILICSTKKDDLSVSPTLETLSTFNTQSLAPTYNDTDAILNITIWN